MFGFLVVFEEISCFYKEKVFLISVRFCSYENSCKKQAFLLDKAMKKACSNLIFVP